MCFYKKLTISTIFLQTLSAFLFLTTFYSLVNNSNYLYAFN
jgi:hypothetical protein